ncbi:hypothetical protein C8J36_10163 [Rhizobium sp. PP-F2F-G48]|uniref:hypothetical protein n=1 Tax=Rhizobium sp. PP-F2F-G48 TaxID=2135651 RepID=UPI00104A4F1F|nr:hypothetical protein [Rhizobium sp. PP-F2F-G48]TCM58165.1 hypothetical protein C8J36_10163 [Rhizobium sp. PP-F2F-G48]
MARAKSKARTPNGMRKAVFSDDMFGPGIDSPADEVVNDAGWWGFLGTRPWMRAQHNLGLALIAAGDHSDATPSKTATKDTSP